MYPYSESPGGGAGTLTLDTRTTSDAYASNKSSVIEAGNSDLGTQEIFASLPPLSEGDEDAKVPPLVPTRSPLRTLSNRSSVRRASDYRGGSVAAAEMSDD